MPILYESPEQTRQGRGQYFQVHFKAKCPDGNCDTLAQTVKTKALHYNWLKHGLTLLDAEVTPTEGYIDGIITFKASNAFFPIALLIPLIPGILGLVGTLAQLFVITTVVNPLLAPGPLGLPMIAWILITAGMVVIPVAVIYVKRR